MTDIEADLMIANAEIKRLQAHLAKYDEVAAEYGIDGKTMLTLAKSQIKTAQDNIKLQAQLAERDRTIERLREAIASVHKSLDFADGQRQSCKNYTELAINNGLALGRIAVTLKHDFKEPLPASPAVYQWFLNHCREEKSGFYQIRFPNKPWLTMNLNENAGEGGQDD